MTETYITRQGDVLDAICRNYYGSSTKTLEQVLEANPGLAEKGPVYQAGITILLPALAKPAQQQTIALWD